MLRERAARTGECELNGRREVGASTKRAVMPSRSFTHLEWVQFSLQGACNRSTLSHFAWLRGISTHGFGRRVLCGVSYPLQKVVMVGASVHIGGAPPGCLALAWG